jgi:hypothetical protein
VAGSVIRLKDGGKKLGAYRSYPRFDPRCDLGGGVKRVFKIVFEIPSQVFLVLRADSKFEVGNSGLAGPTVTLICNFRTMPVSAFSKLCETQSVHGPRI